MNTLHSAFASSYGVARERFRSAAAASGATVDTYEHPKARGPAGEALAMDIAWLGGAAGAPLLVVTSGTHGVEGYCGSGIQVALLEDPALQPALKASGAALALIHAVNPYGFAHVRRNNEDNVDLNRNFRDFREPMPANRDYAEIHPFIVPSAWPPAPADQQALGAYLARHGVGRLQAALTTGQHQFADGMFFGGTAPAWSNRTLRAFFRAHATKRPALGWIDIHTGLGPSGHGEKIYSGPDDAAMLARTRAWFGADVTSFYTGSSASAAVTGSISAAAVDECPGVPYAGIGLEFGTVPLLEALNALRADQWLHNQREPTPPAAAGIKAALRDAFLVDSDDWRGMVYGQGRAAVFAALRGLAAGT